MRIHIFGAYGSGKSTIAKRLSEIFKIKIYSLDDLKYKTKYSEIRPVRDRINLLRKITKKKNWITEGTWSDYAEDAFKNADILIYMDSPKAICAYRILKRHLSRKKYKRDTLLMTLKLVKEMYLYHFTKRPVSLKAHKDLVFKYKKRVLVVKDEASLLNAINKIENLCNK